MRWLNAEKYHLRGADIIGKTNHGAHVVGSEEVVGEDDGTRNRLIKRFRMGFCEKIVGFEIHDRTDRANRTNKTNKTYKGGLDKCCVLQDAFQLTKALGRSGG